MCTSLGRREVGEEEIGFAAFLSKPIRQSQIFDTLVTVFEDELHDHAPGADAAAGQIDAQLGQRLPLRILVAEDNAINQRLALLLLDQMGYRADLAGNGLEAIAAIERQPYDVILMDVQMPEMDGLEASRQICARWPQDRRPRIIAMTANAMQGDREMCLNAGMDDYLTKPIRVDELTAALRRCRPVMYDNQPLEPVTMRVARRRPTLEFRITPPADEPAGSSGVAGGAAIDTRRNGAAEPADLPANGAGAAPGTPGDTGGPPSPDSPAHAANGSPASAEEPSAPSVDATDGTLDPVALDRLKAMLAKAPPGALAQLIDSFLQNAPKLLHDINEGIEHGKGDDLRRAAHTLKSNAATFGAMKLSAICQDLENHGKASDFEGAVALAARAAWEYASAKPALEALRAGV
jgi:CheY-like chemotaxis protein